MSAQISIILKGPQEFEDGPSIITSEAIDFIPGETVEQLVSRVLYKQAANRYKTTESGIHPIEFVPWFSASLQAIEIRLIREVV